MKGKMQSIDGWLRQRLKCFGLKQCKRTIGIVRWLMKLAVEEILSLRTALSGKGWWLISNIPAINIGNNNKWFAAQDYYSPGENYKCFYLNHFKEIAVLASTYGGVRGLQRVLSLSPTLFYK
jgi:hypothetical protein